MPDSVLLDIQRHLKITGVSSEQPLNLAWPGAENYTINIKRDDLLHPVISGNKWRKLKYALLAARQQHVRHILSFGGGELTQ